MAAASLQERQLQFQRQALTLRADESAALATRLYNSLNPDVYVSRAPILFYAYVEPLPGETPPKRKRRRSGAWYDVLGLTKCEEDEARVRNHQNCFVRYEKLESRCLDDADLSRLLLDSEDVYLRFARHKATLRGMVMEFIVTEVTVRCVQRVPNTFGHALARWFGHGPPERVLHECRLDIDWALTMQRRTRHLHAQKEALLLTASQSLSRVVRSTTTSTLRSASDDSSDEPAVPKLVASTSRTRSEGGRAAAESSHSRSER